MTAPATDRSDEHEANASPRRNWITDSPYWATSAALHLLLALLLLAWAIPSEQSPPEEVVINVSTAHKPRPYDYKKERSTRPKPQIVERQKSEETFLVRKIDEVTPDIPKGERLDNLTNQNLEALSINAAIGTQGGAAGAYGSRLGDRTRLRDDEGGAGSEEAVRAALEWLRRHQNDDGSWSARDFTKNCKLACTNENTERYGDGRGHENHDVGVTALAVLAFTGYGHTHRHGTIPEYVDVLKRAAHFLKSVQVRSSNPSEDGRYGNSADLHEQWMYDHTIATMAMGELLVMSNDVIGLKRSVTAAVKLILRAQNDGFGWRYEIKDGDNDTSVTGWAVLALKTARQMRLDVAEVDYARAFAGALHWIDRATSTTGRTGYQVPGDEGARPSDISIEPYPFSKEPSCMTAVAVLCRIFAGDSRKGRAIRDGVQLLMRHLPKWQEQSGRILSEINFYYWYYASYALFQYGGKEWRRWNESMLATLIATQRRGNIDEDGSWDPIGEWGAAGGRVYATALGAMTLEVYYRFRRAEEFTGF